MDTEQMIELKVRRRIDEEVVKYRQFLESQFRRIVWLISGVIIVGGGILVYLITDTRGGIESEFERKKKELIDQIDSEFLRYRVDKKVNKEITDRIQNAIEQEIQEVLPLQVENAVDKELQNTQEKLKQQAENIIKTDFQKAKDTLENSAREITESTKNNLDYTLKQISAESNKSLEYLKNKESEIFQKLRMSDLEEIYKEALIPVNAVVAFDIQGGCPTGWEPFEDTAGRTIIGAGKGRDLLFRRFREIGGEENHTLTVPEIPAHSHTEKMPVAFDNNNNRRYATEVGNAKDLIRPEEVDSGITGGNRPHNNMPPFIALQICVKKDS